MSITRVPGDILTYMGGYFRPQDAAQLIQTCKTMQNAYDTEDFWKRKVTQIYPPFNHNNPQFPPHLNKVLLKMHIFYCCCSSEVFAKPDHFFSRIFSEWAKQEVVKQRELGELELSEAKATVIRKLVFETCLSARFYSDLKHRRYKNLKFI